MELAGVGIWSFPLRYGDLSESAEAAAELEELGFTALWVPDVGGSLFEAVEALLGSTRRAVVATGILNIWMHTPDEAAAEFARLTGTYGDRLLMGVGVSHAPALAPGLYRKPLTAMSGFLDGLDAASPPVPIDSRVLAALGPKMLDLAATRGRGVHPYLVTPEHTRQARAAVGPDALVLPEQTVILCSTRDEARTIGSGWLGQYLAMPNYANSVQRLGFSADDVSALSDGLFDALIAWGDEEAILRRVDEHRDAGADHVCIQVLAPDLRVLPREQWRRLAAALAGR